MSFDLAWAAGIVDGEGCISLVFQKSKQRGKEYSTFCVRLTVVNTDPRMVLKLKRMFGGNIRRNVLPAPRKPRYDWILNAKKAEDALTAMLPWLCVKREQAELAISSRQYRGRYSRKGAYTVEHIRPNMSMLCNLSDALKSLKRETIAI